MRDLTERQRAILQYIADFWSEEQRPPTIRDIGLYFGIASLNGVVCHLDAIERKGYIERIRNSARGIKILKVIPATPAKLAVV